MKKKKPVEPKPSFISSVPPYIHFKHLRVRAWAVVFIIACIWVVTQCSEKTIENLKLAERGKLVKAHVIGKRTIGAKGTVLLKFRYEINGQRLASEIIADDYEVGDDAYLLYLEESPEVMRTYRFINENYSTDIKLPE